ncbi:hypothetical protein G6F66_001009 [Rhizopus arrhizus]|nr:hypothetical protein G6F66_001009 [Rhizopus arrhizus]
MSTEFDILEDDPDMYFTELNIPEVRDLEQKTRAEIESKKNELRTMVGEQYLELMSTADAIITMRKNTQVVQTNICRMQAACNVEHIKTSEASNANDSRIRVDSERQHVYLVASLIKSLVDVSEQIWHALENHQYLHASRLYALAKAAHEYLEEEKKTSTLDIETNFPVIQSQWDAISSFESQIIQRSIHYLQISEQTSEHLAETLLGLVFLNGFSFKDALDKLLEMRTRVIEDLLQHKSKKMENSIHFIARQLKDIILVFKQTFAQIDNVFCLKKEDEMTLIEFYTSHFQKTFLIPSNTSSSGNSSQLPITRLFSPSSNVHLIIRYLPESVQKYKPSLDPGSSLALEDIQQIMTAWVERIEILLKEYLPEILIALDTEGKLVSVRSKIWTLLGEADADNTWQSISQRLLSRHYPIWERHLRASFNCRSKQIIDEQLDILSNQPEKNVWPLIVPNSNKEEVSKNITMTMNIWPGIGSKAAFSLPNVSSKKELDQFKSALTDTVNDKTNVSRKLQNMFDTLLCDLRKDVLVHLQPNENATFCAEEDSNDIKAYFQNKCYESVMAYSFKLRSLIKRLHDWSNKKIASDISLFIARIARNIALSSKELPKALALSAETLPAFVLRSEVNKDPKYTKVQNEFLEAFHEAHILWLSLLESNFSQKLEEILRATKWDNGCASAWGNVEEDIRLPTQSTGAMTRLIFSICEEIQRANSHMLDQIIMKRLRQMLHKKMNEVFQSFLCSKDSDITEYGSLQMIFDYLFLKSIFQQYEEKSSLLNDDNVLDELQKKVDPINWESYKPHISSCVDKFCIKQSLLFGVLTNAGSATYER